MRPWPQRGGVQVDQRTAIGVPGEPLVAKFQDSTAISSNLPANVSVRCSKFVVRKELTLQYWWGSFCYIIHCQENSCQNLQLDISGTPNLELPPELVLDIQSLGKMQNSQSFSWGSWRSWQGKVGMWSSPSHQSQTYGVRHLTEYHTQKYQWLLLSSCVQGAQK